MTILQSRLAAFRLIHGPRAHNCTYSFIVAAPASEHKSLTGPKRISVGFPGKGELEQCHFVVWLVQLFQLRAQFPCN